jgi:hypothetical protein
VSLEPVTEPPFPAISLSPTISNQPSTSIEPSSLPTAEPSPAPIAPIAPSPTFLVKIDITIDTTPEEVSWGLSTSAGIFEAGNGVGSYTSTGATSKLAILASGAHILEVSNASGLGGK